MFDFKILFPAVLLLRLQFPILSYFQVTQLLCLMKVKPHLSSFLGLTLYLYCLTLQSNLLPCTLIVSLQF